jgi:DinB superfamily
MPHPLVDQLRFTRAEWLRGLDGVSESDGVRRILPMNSLSWIVGHLAWHEREVWVSRGLGRSVEPVLEAVASEMPGSSPSFETMSAAWSRIVALSDPLLDGLTVAAMTQPLPFDRGSEPPSAGTELFHVLYHYWSHIGEASAIRQMLGHANPPEFVGDIERDAPWRREG